MVLGARLLDQQVHRALLEACTLRTRVVDLELRAAAEAHHVRVIQTRALRIYNRVYKNDPRTTLNNPSDGPQYFK